MNLKKYISELKRRNIFRAGIAYLVVAWVITEVGSVVLPAFGVAPFIFRLILIILGIGFPIWLIFVWVYELTPQGIKKTTSVDPKSSITRKTSNRLNQVIIASLSIAVILLLVNQFWNTPSKADNIDPDKKATGLLAVLPFSNTKPDPETDYLGFAIADQIIGSLAYLNNITVRPSGSIRKYNKQVTDPITAGADLKVDYILIGNYLQEANIIRLNVELVDVTTNEMIWRQPIEVDFQSAFELQDIVAQKVVEGLGIQFPQEELDLIKKDIPDDPLAYEYYLRSISYPLTNDGYLLAIEMLNRSIDLDSNYAPAYNELGYRYSQLSIYGLRDSEQTKKIVENYYLKALSLNGKLLTALGNLSRFYTETGSIEKAVELTKKMLDINPNNAEAHYALGYIYRYAGMLDEAIHEMEKAVALDPKNSRFRTLGITYIYVGEYEKAFDALEIDKGSTFTIGWQGTILFRQGNEKQAVKYLNRVIDVEPEGLMGLYATVIRAIINGNIQEGLTVTQKLEQANFKDAETLYNTTASFYALLGDRDGCIRTLRRTVDGGYFNYPFFLTDFYLDSMRDDPEFQEILAIAKKKHLAFKKRFF